MIENYTPEEKLEAVCNWCDNCGIEFDDRTVKRIKVNWDNHKYISEGSQKAIDNIIIGYDIDIDKWIELYN